MSNSGSQSAKLAIVLCALLTMQARSQPLCTEPAAPGCLDAPIDDEPSYDFCQSEMERHRDAVQQYISCSNDEAERMKGVFKRRVKRFNCLAQKEIVCPSAR
jgi:hypothetical protein